MKGLYRVQATVDFSLVAESADEAKEIIEKALESGDGEKLAGCIAASEVLSSELDE